MKVAFCTQDMQHVDAHFGWAKNIAIYEVGRDGYSFVETCQFGGSMFEDGNEDKLVPKLEALADVAIVYLSAIGASAAARVVAKKIHPVKVEASESITALLDRLVTTINGNPPPWLRKAMSAGQPQTFDFDEEE
ncbi:nitrogen fixation protein NifX [Azospirillum thermophilum]|uniref:Nitrogen fixation protein NifX n=1 Tax=Azospirillum thermophilum TaxID=2202148 RepID=A0A2S2CU81_9PROT|nr:nitrogen fixation protein NifX [Azospirillum thermophilum]AWK88036.1 nitrogen fixation protein NifX [Azospirillum thermophilum]